MTIEEAVRRLQEIIEYPTCGIDSMDEIALEMAIKALEDKGYEQGYADGFAECLELNT